MDEFDLIGEDFLAAFLAGSDDADHLAMARIVKNAEVGAIDGVVDADDVAGFVESESRLEPLLQLTSAIQVNRVHYPVSQAVDDRNAVLFIGCGLELHHSAGHDGDSNGWAQQSARIVAQKTVGIVD